MAPSAPGHALVMLRPCPHDGVLEVVRWQGDRYLFHRLTGECAKLPADIDWRLTFEGGQGILSDASAPAGERIWAHSFLQIHVGELAGQEGQLELRRVDGVRHRAPLQKSLAEEQRPMHRASLPVRRGLGGASEHFEIFLLEKAEGGAHVSCVGR